jgi:putative serine protease PepD
MTILRWFRLLLLLCLVPQHEVAAAASCDKTFTEVFRDISPSVVQVFSVSIDPFSVLERVQHGVGTGFVIDDEGHIATNAHLVHGASEVMVTLADDEVLPAEIVGIDPVADLAIIRIPEPAVEITKAPIGSSADLEVGEEVLAVGFPFGIGKTATRGIVSGVERVVPFTTWSWAHPMIQTDAAISPGNSGGPLVDRCGKVVAINTLSSREGQNINLSIPIDLARELFPEIIETGRVSRAWHGINGVIVPMPFVFMLGIPPGYMIETIEPGSPAEQLGLRGGTFPVVVGNNEFLLGGDVIREVNGEKVSDMDTVYRIAKSLRVGDTIEIKYFRDGELQTAQVVLPERPLLPGDLRRFQESRVRK